MTVILRIECEDDTLCLGGAEYCKSKYNGTINVELTDSWEFSQQMEELPTQLERTMAELSQLPNAKALCVDVGYEARDAAVETNAVPCEVVQLLARFDVVLELSRYPQSR